MSVNSKLNAILTGQAAILTAISNITPGEGHSQEIAEALARIEAGVSDINADIGEDTVEGGANPA